MEENQKELYGSYKAKMVCLAIHMTDYSEKILQKRHLTKKDIQFLQLTAKMADHVLSLVMDFLR